jgi:hypothetical protein
VEPRLEHLRQLTPPPRRATARGLARTPRPSRVARPRSERDAPQLPLPVKGSEPSPIRDRGISLLATFTIAILVIVALVWLVGGVDRWWILIPVMAALLTVTGLVLTVVIRLLEDGSGS